MVNIAKKPFTIRKSKKKWIIGIGAAVTFISAVALFTLLSSFGVIFTSPDIKCGSYCESYINYSNLTREYKMNNLSLLKVDFYPNAKDWNLLFPTSSGYESYKNLSSFTFKPNGKPLKLIGHKNPNETLKWNLTFGNNILDPKWEGITGPTKIGEVGQDSIIEIVSQDYIDSYFSWTFTRINDSLWNASFSIDKKFLENLTYCRARTSAQKTTCYTNMRNNWTAIQNYTTAKVRADIENITNYTKTLKVVKGTASFQNAVFNAITGNGSFLINFTNGFQEGVELKFGFNSTLINTSASNTALDTTQQRKLFYAQGRYWLFYFNNTNIVYTSSTDGTTWTLSTSWRVAASAGNDFSVWENETHAFYVIRDGNNLNYSRGSISSGGTISFDAESVAVYTNGMQVRPVIAVDTAGYAWITYVAINDTSYWVPYITKNANANSSTWANDTGFPYQHPVGSYNGGNSSNWAVGIIPMTSSKVMAMYASYGLNFNTQKWNGTTWASVVTVGAGPPTTAPAASVFSASANGDTIHLAKKRYGGGFTGGTFYHYYNGTNWGSEWQLDNSSSFPPQLTYSPITNLAYIFYANGTQNITYATTNGTIFTRNFTILEADPLSSNEDMTAMYQEENGIVPIVWRNKTEGTAGGRIKIYLLDVASPTWSQNSTSGTQAGTSVTHSVYWQDNLQLDGYIFSFQNGTNSDWVNDSFVKFNGGVWSNVTKIINSTVGSQISWFVWANDTANNTNTTSTFSYTTTSGGGAGADYISITGQNPQNTTYTSGNISLNHTESTNLTTDKCWYTLNNTANVTLTNCQNTTIMLGSGYYNITYGTNSTSGVFNQSDTTWFTVSIPGGNWWNTDWNYCQVISQTNASVSMRANYTQRIVLNTTNTNYSRFMSDGNDTRFVNGSDCNSAGQTQYGYKIRFTWNSSGNTTIDVNTNDSTFLMYFGNAAASKGENGNATYLLYDEFNGAAATSNWTAWGNPLGKFNTTIGNPMPSLQGNGDGNGQSGWVSANGWNYTSGFAMEADWYDNTTLRTMQMGLTNHTGTDENKGCLADVAGGTLAQIGTGEGQLTKTYWCYNNGTDTQSSYYQSFDNRGAWQRVRLEIYPNLTWKGYMNETNYYNSVTYGNLSINRSSLNDTAYAFLSGHDANDWMDNVRMMYWTTGTTYSIGQVQNQTQSAANTCTPINNAQWDLNCADNCTITGVNVNVTNWRINSTASGTVNITGSSIGYRNITFGSIVGTCIINKNGFLNLTGG